MIVGLGLACLASAWAPAFEFDLSRSTISGGGSMLGSGGNFELSATIVPTNAGSSAAGGRFELTGGFWFPLVPGDCEEDGGSGLQDFESVTTCLRGPGDLIADQNCACADFDADGDIDLRDIALHQIAFTGG